MDVNFLPRFSRPGYQSHGNERGSPAQAEKPHTSTRWLNDLSATLTLLLALATLVYQGYHLAIAVQADDTNHLETPLALAVANQLERGPARLYGPFSGRQPLVLVHAPLYYRLAGSGSWILAKAGLEGISASLVAGRTISLLAALAALVAVYRLAVHGVLPPKAGVWAALLLASSPILGSFPVTVRPDTLGLALQTWGVVCVLDGLRHESVVMRSFVLGYLAFGLAACTKQHDVITCIICSGLLASEAARRRVRVAPLIVAHIAAIAVVIIVYAVEERITRGMMIRSVFYLPHAFGRVAHASWSHVLTVFGEVAKRSLGLIGLGAACVVANPRRALLDRLDCWLWLLLAAETAAAAFLCLGSTGAWVNYALQAVAFGSVLVGRGLARVTEARLSPGSLVAEPGMAESRTPHPDASRRPSPARGEGPFSLLRSMVGRRATPLSPCGRGWSAGADRVRGETRVRHYVKSDDAWTSVPVLLAGLALLGVDARLAWISLRARQEDHHAIQSLLADPRVASRTADERYFVAAPQYNRLYGRRDLAHDEWLYDQYEAVRAAEPREGWLRDALTSGAVSQVIVNGPGVTVPGVRARLPQLGYRIVDEFGRFRVWERTRSCAGPWTWLLPPRLAPADA
jgi:hypothetical protein